VERRCGKRPRRGQSHALYHLSGGLRARPDRKKKREVSMERLSAVDIAVDIHMIELISGADREFTVLFETKAKDRYHLVFDRVYDMRYAVENASIGRFYDFRRHTPHVIWNTSLFMVENSEYIKYFEEQVSGTMPTDNLMHICICDDVDTTLDVLTDKAPTLMKVDSEHRADTPATEISLEDAIKDASNPPARPEGEVYAYIQRDGTQVWVAARNGLIWDCGVNKTTPDNKTTSGKKMITAKQAYDAAYYLLEKYQHVYGLGGEFRSFDLGSLLTFMAPMDNTVSFDQAYWIDWLEILKEEGISGDMDKEEVLRATRAFTQKYVHEFGFGLGAALQQLQETTPDDPDLTEAIQKAEADQKNRTEQRWDTKAEEQPGTSKYRIDTPANRAFLENMTKDASKYIGVHREGSDVYAYIQRDRTQVWVYTRDGLIEDCGVNKTPWTTQQLLGRKE
jgi:hypothetical protein